MSKLINLNITPTFRVKNRESDQREFKREFNKENLWKYAKTLVSFANKNGGTIFFGIKDRPRELIGIKKTEFNDLVFSNFLNEFFEPTIDIKVDTQVHEGRTFSFVTVKASSDKPIICRKRKIQQSNETGKKDKELLREGAIYYRYSSSTTEIKHSELRKIFDEQMEKYFKSLVENITIIKKIGYNRAAIVNATDLHGNDKTASVYITTETAKNINWIQKGRFSEDELADKAFYVTREIEIKHGVEIEKIVDPSRTHILTKTALSKEINIHGTNVNAILWKLGILDNNQYHIYMTHGKNNLDKFTEKAKDKILKNFPLEMENRKTQIKNVHEDYIKSQKNT